MRRYDLENYEDSLSIMDVAPDGDWVDYDDAIEAIAEARQEAAREILHIISMETMDRPFEQSQAVEIIKTRFKLEG